MTVLAPTSVPPVALSVFGDESSSSAIAGYGLFAALDGDLPLIASLVAGTKAALKTTVDEPLHCSVLFHESRRSKSAFAVATRPDVERACTKLIGEIARLRCSFYFGRVDRLSAPKILHIALMSDQERDVVLYGKTKVELGHLQWFAYGAAATRACHRLVQPAQRRLIVDENKSVIRWFNERRQASRLLETLFMDQSLPTWPPPTLADDADHPGLQVADILTYYAVKQFTDLRFATAFDQIRDRADFVEYVFDDQVRRPYVAPPGVTVREMTHRR
jgi:hypothetical protein